MINLGAQGNYMSLEVTQFFYTQVKDKPYRLVIADSTNTTLHNRLVDVKTTEVLIDIKAGLKDKTH